MRQAGEPSVEEILESIKQVMAARDQRGLAADGGRAPDDTGDGVLDLGAYHAPPPADAPAPPDGKGEGEDVPGPLMTDTASDAMRGSLDTLALFAGSDATTPGTGGSSLDAIVREMLRPVLAEWLDQHLPPIVERLVAAEIARIVGKRW